MTFDLPPDQPTRTVGGDQLRAALQEQVHRRRQGLAVLIIGVVLVLVALVFAVGPARTNESTGRLTTNQTTEQPPTTQGSGPAAKSAAGTAAGGSGGQTPAPAAAVLPRAGAPSASSPAPDSSGAARPAKSPSTPTTPRPDPTTVPAKTSPPTSPATTVAPNLPACAASQFAPTVATDQSSYQSGQTMGITVTVTNTGPACSGPDPVPCAVEATAADSSGSPVWDSSADGAPTNPTGCPETAPSTIGSGWKATTSLPWGQGYCTDNSAGRDCPEAQVPDGTYAIVGMVDGTDSPAVTVTITG